MKIAIFHELPEGGAKRVVLEQIKRLKTKHSVDIHLTEKAFFPGAKGIPRLPFRHGGQAPSRWKTDLFKFWSLRQIHQALAVKIDRKGYDVVLVHPSQFTQAPYLLKYLQTPSVYYLHEPLRIAYEYNLRFQEKVSVFKRIYEDFTRKILKKIDFENARAAKKVVVNSYHTLEMAIKIYGIYPAVCYPGVDANHFRPLSRVEKEGILFVGNPEKITGFDFLKKTISLIKPLPKLTVVKGDLNENKLVEAYNQAMLTVGVAEIEPFGLVPLESMACGTPVVAMKEGGYRESVVDEITGFLVDREPEIFAQKIELLLKNKDLAYQMGQNGREYVKRLWSWERSIKRLEAVLEETRGVKGNTHPVCVK